MMRDLATFATEKSNFALLREHDTAKAEALLVITGDRGLAGAFNANVLRACFAAGRDSGRGSIAGCWSWARRASAPCAFAA